MKHPAMIVLAGSLLALTTSAAADELNEIRQALQSLQADYQARIDDLEQRLAQAERALQRVARDADQAVEIAETTAISASSGATARNAFNPAIGMVLAARAADVGQGWESIPGFLPGGEVGPGNSGFSLGESELNLNANVDDRFFGNLTLALEDEGGTTEVSLEEAWIQTTALPHGLTFRTGRQFSGIGYLNSFHRHADDFMDRPLPYQAFLGGQYAPDGAQLRWIAPTDLFIELGGELSWGSRFPASGSDHTAPDAWSVFAHVSPNLGDSHTWQFGASYLSADADNRPSIGPEPGFTGNSDLYLLDFVWKWAPAGNASTTSFKVQGEFFWREEDGRFGAAEYDGKQDGWYLQSVWQFAPRWRIGYRHDEVDSHNGAAFNGTVLEDPNNAPKRDSFMIDWSNSEFSRLRLQYNHDAVLNDSDDQLFLQYIMSLGAHGAHQF